MRWLAALVLLAAAVAGGAFFAGHPGQVEIVWQGWQVETSVALLAAAIAVLAFLAGLAAIAVAALYRLPGATRRRRAARRRRAGDAALTGGLVALAAGDAAAAARHAKRAAALLDFSPVALLLAAEAAGRQGDAAAAQRAYAALLEHPQTEFLGLRGLIGQALRQGEDGVALRLAERARLLRPAAGWPAESALLLQARSGDWEGARETLAGAARRGAIPAETGRHQQGVVLYELSREAERQGDARRATALAAKAQALAPDLAPVAAHHARLLFATGRRRAAVKTIERAWRAAPHPELARLYVEARDAEPGGDGGPLGRAAALQRLARRNPEALESHLAIAEAALSAQLWGEARRHLALAEAAAPPPAGPPRRLCLLMARLEEGESGNAVGARAWLDRAIGAAADPCYVCGRCAAAAVAWQALCPACGGFDTLRWETPDRTAGAARPRSSVTNAGASLKQAPLQLFPACVGALPGDKRLIEAPRQDDASLPAPGAPRGQTPGPH